MKKLIYKINILILLMILFSPKISSAMTIEIGKQIEKIPQEETVILDVYLNTGEKEINTIEGKIQIDGEYKIEALSTAGSIFDLWPNKPSFVDGVISFTGGSPSGFFGSRLKIFSIAITPKSDENIIFSSEDISVFLNNGIGTKVNIEPFNRSIEISETTDSKRNDMQTLIERDQKKPEEFEILIGQDDSVFEGKYFASFNAIDNQSGINRYEVIEEGYPSVLSGTPYILQNQDLKGTLIVRAIDNAGNIRESKINIQDGVGKDSINWLSLSVVILLLFGIYGVSYFLKRKKKNEIS